jgi:hypothetical protein
MGDGLVTEAIRQVKLANRTGISHIHTVGANSQRTWKPLQLPTSSDTHADKEDLSWPELPSTSRMILPQPTADRLLALLTQLSHQNVRIASLFATRVPTIRWPRLEERRPEAWPPLRLYLQGGPVPCALLLLEPHAPSSSHLSSTSLMCTWTTSTQKLHHGRRFPYAYTTACQTRLFCAAANGIESVTCGTGARLTL